MWERVIGLSGATWVGDDGVCDVASRDGDETASPSTFTAGDGGDGVTSKSNSPSKSPRCHISKCFHFQVPKQHEVFARKTNYNDVLNYNNGLSESPRHRVGHLEECFDGTGDCTFRSQKPS